MTKKQGKRVWIHRLAYNELTSVMIGNGEPDWHGFTYGWQNQSNVHVKICSTAEVESIFGIKVPPYPYLLEFTVSAEEICIWKPAELHDEDEIYV